MRERERLVKQHNASVSLYYYSALPLSFYADHNSSKVQTLNSNHNHSIQQTQLTLLQAQYILHNIIMLHA